MVGPLRGGKPPEETLKKQLVKKNTKTIHYTYNCFILIQIYYFIFDGLPILEAIGRGQGEPG